MSKFISSDIVVSEKGNEKFQEPKNVYFDSKVQAFPSTIWQLNLLSQFGRNWTENDNQELVKLRSNISERVSLNEVSLQDASTHKTLNKFVSFILNTNILPEISIECGYTSLFVTSLNSQATCTVLSPIVGIYCASKTDIVCCISRPTSMMKYSLDEKMIKYNNLFNVDNINFDMSMGSMIIFPSWLSFKMLYDDKPILYSFSALPANNPREKIFADARQTWFQGCHQ